MPHALLERRLLVLGLFLALVGSSACATPPDTRTEDYDYFSQPSAADPWSPKIAGWQVREQRSIRGIAVPPRAVRSRGPDLRTKYAALRRSYVRSGLPPSEVAERLAAWVQRQAPDHYLPDGAIDHWATLEDTLARNGDDCDGLELLTYKALREFGFGDERVFRAIVYRPEDGQHHMVTLWFETSDDPFVLDPTGAMTRGMPRMSEIDGWVPLKVFSETREFSVRRTLSFASAR